MKSIKLILVSAFALVGFTAVAQDINYDDPKYAKWGSTAEERKEMMLNAQFLKEAVDNRNYNLASGYLQALLATSHRRFCRPRRRNNRLR